MNDDDDGYVDTTVSDAASPFHASASNALTIQTCNIAPNEASILFDKIRECLKPDEPIEFVTVIVQTLGYDFVCSVVHFHV